jgi:hypothetical protein
MSANDRSLYQIERKPVCERCKLFANALRPDSFTGRVAVDHGDGFGIWQQLLNIRDDGWQVVRDRDDGVIFRRLET